MPSSARFITRPVLAFAMITALLAQGLDTGHGALQLGIAPAAAQNKSSSSQHSNSKVIQLLLASTREENPARAIELLKLAREELKKEGLPEADTTRILALIQDLENKAAAKLEKSSGFTEAIAGTTDFGTAKSRFAGKLPAVTSLEDLKDASADDGKSLAANPEVRDTMWEISRSRLARDSQNLEAIIKERTGKSVEQIDESENEARTEANKPSAFLQLLNNFDILKLDFTQANLKLKQEYSGVSLDVLADKLTFDAAKFSFPVGVVKGSIGQIGPAFRLVGVPSEVIANFLINAKLVLRIADLYGIELADSEKQIVLLSVYSALKVGAQYGGKANSTDGLMKTFAQKFAQLKYSGRVGELVSWIQKFTSNPAIAKIAGPAMTEAALVTPAETSKAATESATKSTASPGEATPKKKFESIRAIGGRINLMGLLAAGGQGALSAGETYAMGHLAKMLFSSARDEKRIIYNEEFRRFLMTPAGEGFFKLLISSMNDGRPSLGITQNARSHGEMKLKSDFILNLARSARVCSTEDLKVLSEGKASRSAADVANYACKANSNTARSERLRNEFLTFDAIPQDYVADLRIAAREHRLRMAELILQLQFLDGDRSPSETQFFREVVTKALGVDSPAYLDYFERLHSYIHESGGLVEASDTPSGVAVRTDAIVRPYNMARGYTAPNGPEPAPETVPPKMKNQKTK